LAEAQKLETGDYRSFLSRAATYAQLGRLAEAKREIAEMQALEPGLPDDMRRDLIEHHGFALELIDHLLEGLRKAGQADSEPSMAGD
jgi:hypothetical protein